MGASDSSARLLCMRVVLLLGVLLFPQIGVFAGRYSAFGQDRADPARSVSGEEEAAAEAFRQVRMERKALWQALLPVCLLLWGAVFAYLVYLRRKQGRLERAIEVLSEQISDQSKTMSSR